MSKKTRSEAPVSNYSPVGPVKQCSGTNMALSQAAIDRHWSIFPPRARNFILGTTDIVPNIWKLLEFWSSPANIEYTRGTLAGSICISAWPLALAFLKLNRVNEAKSLMVNGSFIHQCFNSSIEHVISLFETGGDIQEKQLPYFIRGVDSMQSPKTMELYIQSYMPEMQMMTPFAYTSSRKHVMDYIDQISDDWKGNSSASRGRNGQRRTSNTKDGTLFTLILVDHANEDERQSLDISSSTTLKTFFNKYADKRGISLRLLRFYYKDKYLFLSSVGHKTPEELGMQDQDVITVHDASKHQVTGNGNSSSERTPTSKKKTSRKPSKKKANGKKKGEHQYRESMTTLEEYKILHSKQLTKIHEEVQAQFKQIRQRLNNLVIERSHRKIKSKHSGIHKNKCIQPDVARNTNAKADIDGIPGKAYYDIHVGEVQNLYKTSKPSALGVASHLSSSRMTLTLDLHGFTREEALKKLDESLRVWVNTAMEGTYPFVQPAQIVCGYGSQILSEIVRDWIRSNDNVSNAPQIRSPGW